MTIPFLANRQLPDSNLHAPIEPQRWHFRQSIDYSLTANWAVLDIASRNRENFLFNIYRMGKNSIERGSRDSWTATPRRIIAARTALQSAGGRGQGGRGGADAPPAGDEPPARGGGGGGVGRGGGTPEDFKKLLRDPAMRDPRGFILPADQPDFPTATKFVNALIKTGVTVHRAKAPFTVANKNYPAGSYVVKAAQAFRPHVLDMFEPQDHPDDIPYPGGPPTRPYDNAGWTLAYQMGVRFDRILDDLNGPFEVVNGLQNPMPGKVASTSGRLVFSHENNNSVIAANRLVKAGHEVWWNQNTPGLFVTTAPAAELRRLSSELGVNFDQPPAAMAMGGAIKLRTLRIALADQYGGSMPSGWTRWLLEQFEFPFDVVFPQALNTLSLASKYDVIIFPSGVGPAPPSAERSEGGGTESRERNIPAEYQHMTGDYTAAGIFPALKRFVEGGGVVLAVGRSSMNLARLFELPVANHLAEKSPDGTTRSLASEKYYVPGSVLRVAVDNTVPLAHGIARHVDVFFNNSPVFKLAPDAQSKGLRPVAWFDSAKPLRSGWAYGQGYLEGGVQVVDASVGKGKLFLFAPEITFRAQPHGTFKFLFNGIYLAARSAPSTTPTAAK
jgi:hypothetical protein